MCTPKHHNLNNLGIRQEIWQNLFGKIDFVIQTIRKNRFSDPQKPEKSIRVLKVFGKIDFHYAGEVTHPKRKRFADEACMSVQDDRNCSQEDHYRNNVFYVILDCVIGNITNRYDSIHALESMFGFLWKYLNMNDSEKAKFFVSQYAGEVSSELVQEILHLKATHTSNLGEKPLNPIYLLNKLAETSLMGLFPNCCVALRIYCTLPVTVAQAEWSFSILKRIMNYLRSTMCQMRLTSLGTLAVDSELAKQVNYDVLIESFANKKVRKAAVGTAFEL